MKPTRRRPLRVRSYKMEETPEEAPPEKKAEKRKQAEVAERRTPSKRSKRTVVPFQAEIPTPALAIASTSKVDTPEKVLYYPKGEFLTVRNETGTFYLCQTAQNVYKNSKVFRVRWLSLFKAPDVYKLDYLDQTEQECVLTIVKMERVARETYRLPALEKKRAELVLGKTLNMENGEVVDLNDLVVEVEEEPKIKKKRVVESRSVNSTKVKPKPRRKVVVTKATKAPAKKKPAKAKKNKGKKQAQQAKAAKPVKKPEKEEKKAVDKKDPNRRLKPNPAVKVWEKNPFFETNEPVPFLSTSVQNKLLFRAVTLNDNRLLQRLVDDLEHVDSLEPVRSVSRYQFPLEIALEKGNVKAIQLLAKQEDKEKAEKRVSGTYSLLKTITTGTYNPKSLGVAIIRDLTMSRGSREGNNAFTKDLDTEKYKSFKYYLDHCMTNSIKWETVEAYMAATGNALSDTFDSISNAVRLGHQELAGKLVEKAIESGMDFNFLHKEVLQFSTEELRTGIRQASVKKKIFWSNHEITPVHCAAINPNPMYLSKLLSILPDYKIKDQGGWCPVHYAAACTGVKPLEFLVSRGVALDDITRSGMTPLHIASLAGRAHNVDFIMKKAKEMEKELGEDEEQGGPAQNKWGIGGINRPDRGTYCPLHFAVRERHSDVAKALIKHGADVNRQLSAGKDKVTPLMLACQNGNLDIARLLVQHKAQVEQKDKLKRTALIHAVMNGNAHVASYLLSLGANPDHADNSGNTCVHYAAAYGWYFCLKVLLDAGAQPNTPNDWKTTPIGVAFLKGHTGLADILSQQAGVDINFKDDKGMTLVAIAAASPLIGGLYQQVEYLVKQKKADATITDSEGSDPLHHLARNSVMLARAPGTCSWEDYDAVCGDAVELSMKIAKLLIEHGCNPTIRNKVGETPVVAAITQANVQLVEMLVEEGGESVITDETNKDGQNILHLMAKQCSSHDFASLIKIISKHLGKSSMEVEGGGGDAAGESLLSVLASKHDKNGFTPLHLACLNYKQLETADMEKDVDRWKRALDFIQALIDIAGANVNIKVTDKNGAGVPAAESQEDQTQTQTEEDEEEELQRPADIVQNGIKTDDEEEEDDHYDSYDEDDEEEEESHKDKKNKDKNEWANCSALHFLASTSKERSVKEDKHPALTLLLKYKPQLDGYNPQGRTPLILAIRNCIPTMAAALINAGASVNMVSQNKKEDNEATPVILAAKNGQVDTVQLLIKKEAKVTAAEKCCAGNTALHYAAENSGGLSNLQAMELAKYFLNAGATIDARNKEQLTPLHLAVNAHTGAADSSVEMVIFLLDKGADPYAKSVRNRMPIHLAFKKIHKTDMFKQIDPIELCSTLTTAMKGQHISSKDKQGWEPLHLAAWRGATICCMHLIQKGAPVDNKCVCGFTPLAMAIWSKKDSTSIMLIQQGANINATMKSIEKKENKDSKHTWVWRPLQKLSSPKALERHVFQEIVSHDWQGVAYMVLDLLETFNMPYSLALEATLRVNKFNFAMTLIRKCKDRGKLQGTNTDGQNLFHIMANHCSPTSHTDMQMKVAETLLEKGISLEMADKYGCTPLHYACLKQQTLMGNFILDNVKSPNLDQTDIYGRTPLAAFFWNIHASKEFTPLLQRLVKLNGKLDFLCNYPRHDVPTFDYEGVSSELFDYHVQNKMSQISPLILAIHNHNFELAQCLLQSGASVNFPDEDKRTPLMHAVRSNNIDLVRLMLDFSYNNKKKEELENEDEDKESRSAIKRQLSRRMFKFGRNLSKGKMDEEEEDSADEYMDDQDNEEDEKLQKDKEDENDINLDFKPFEKKSNVDMKATDQLGWTVTHHLVCPLEYGTYDNVQLLKLLIDAGAPLDYRDNSGFSPLDHSLIRAAPKLAKALQKLAGKPMDKWDTPVLAFDEFEEEEDNGVPEMPVRDYKADAEAMMLSADKEAMEESGEEETAAKPDQVLLSEMGAALELVMDEEQKLPHDVLLTKVDVQHAPYGLYNFYKLQVVRQTVKDLYVLFNKWGRIGDEGQYQRTPFKNKEEAVKEFCKIFKAKTGNDWNKLDSFENQPKKYRIVQKEEKVIGKAARNIPLNLESTVSSKLPPFMYSLIQDITDMKVMHGVMRNSGVDEQILPLGRLKPETLQQAHKILEELLSLCERIEQGVNMSPLGDRPTQEDRDSYYKDCEEAARLTNEYYHLVPQSGYSFERIPPMALTHDVKSKMRQLNDLMELECAKRICMGAMNKAKEVHPMDYVYQAMGCRISLLQESSQEAQYILRYINTSNYSYEKSRVEAIYKISRRGEQDRFHGCNLGNHKMLWHGSKTANLISILTRGLLISPVEAEDTGSMFGKGIYTADRFSKSFQYCSSSQSKSGRKYMLLTEVALGKCHELLNPQQIEKLGADTNSIKGLGASVPDPAYDIVLPTGAAMPLGKNVKQEFKNFPSDRLLEHSEYIVYDEKQVCLRYLVQFK